MKTSKIFSSVLFCSILSLSPAISAAEDDSGEHLLGNWGGIRSSLAESGVTVESILTLDAVSNLDGGISRETVGLGNFDLTATLDTETFGLWKNGTLFAYFLGNFGDEPSAHIGDLQVTDNIETYSTAKLYEFWYEHRFFEDKFTALIGLHDLNSEFDVLDYAGTFIHASFGIAPDLSQVGPSIFATTALAARFKFQPTENFYALTAVYDGVPGDPENPRGTRIKLRSDDGIYWISEVGAISAEGERHYKAGLGYWYTNTDFEDYAGNERSSNNGIYSLGEVSLFAESEGSEQGLGVFYQLGFAASDRNQISNYLGAGLSYTGLFPSRDEDVFALGMARARNGSAYLEAVGEGDRYETAIEATYRAPLLPYLSVQPDFQYIVNPGTDPALKDAVVLGVRVELAL